MIFEVLKKILERILVEFFNKDKILLQNNSHEQAISHKLACYLEKELEDFLERNNYSVDVEYNRYWEDPKRSKELDNSLIKPDIIIHRRWKNNDGDNLLVFEIKKWVLDWSDINKLKEMTKINWSFWYEYWIWLYNFDSSNNSCDIDIYENWEISEKLLFSNW